MSEKVIARRYAKALFESANEKKVLDNVSDDLDLIFSTFEVNGDFKAVINSQVIQSSDKKNVLEMIFNKKVNVLTLTFLSFLCEKKRIDIILQIIEEFQILYKEERKITDATIESVTPLSEGQVSDIREYLEERYKKKFQIETLVNENLIGGFLIRIGDIVIDKSVKYHLEQLELTLVAE